MKKKKEVLEDRGSSNGSRPVETTTGRWANFHNGPLSPIQAHLSRYSRPIWPGVSSLLYFLVSSIFFLFFVKKTYKGMRQADCVLFYQLKHRLWFIFELELSSLIVLYLPVYTELLEIQGCFISRIQIIHFQQYIFPFSSEILNNKEDLVLTKIILSSPLTPLHSTWLIIFPSDEINNLSDFSKFISTTCK